MDTLEMKKRYILAAIISSISHPERGTIALFVKQKLLDNPGSITLNFDELRVNDPKIIEETRKVLVTVGLVVKDRVLKVPIGGPCVTCGRICSDTCQRRVAWVPGMPITLPQKEFLEEHGGSLGSVL